VTSERKRLIVALVATAALLLPLGWMWQSSLLPDSYSVMDMGYPDYGGGSATMTDHHLMGTSVADLIADPARPADVRLTLTARKQAFRLASGQRVDGYTVNGTSPGPVIHAVEGQLVEVRLVNKSVPDGITLHWHGVDVPNAEDGVAGVTQDAVPMGKSLVYRFVADHVGTYWYHSHQVSHTQVQRGLLGALIVSPKAPVPQNIDQLALLHVYGGLATLNGSTRPLRVDAQDGQTVRVRVINTDNASRRLWSSDPYRVVAIDGYDVNAPTPIGNEKALVTAGGRLDVELTAPALLQMNGGTVIVGGGGKTIRAPIEDLDVLTYGSPADVGFDATAPDRRFRYSIGRRPGFLDGRPGLWWSINGHLFPDVPMFVVEEGDIVTMHISNHSGTTHPMHLHGHHAVVTARNGVKASGSPWWIDSLDVDSGDSYDIAFVADNPGIWMDHCHNLPHAAQGLVAHLMYAGLTEPYRVGGSAKNKPE
jgi:FtsP/CotA-like multicopper oxidase with cupredoxin domain